MMRHPIAHLSWYVALAGLAILAVGNELDRQSLRSPTLAAYVPAPFRGFAQENVTVSAIAANEPERALAEARTLVRRRPVTAENLLLLAAAQDIAGQQAGPTLEQAAQRGWRVPQVQFIMLDSAVRAGNMPVAAARLLALWSVDAPEEMLREGTSQVLATAGGAKAFGTAIASSRFSQNGILRRSLAYTTPAAYVDMIEAAHEAGMKIDCGYRRKLSGAVEKRNAPQEAERLLGADCSVKAGAEASEAD